MIYLKAFLVGGIICTLVQILMDKTKLMPGRIMVLLVIAGAILGSLGWYEKLEAFAECGATVPLSGFGYQLWKGVKESVDQYGFIGLFRGGFEACGVGISGAMILSYLASLLFRPRMKE